MANNEYHFRYILKTSNTIRDVEKRLFFVLSNINVLEEVLDEDEDKKNTIKGLVTWALREFSEGYKCDKRMLNLWKLMGKYSENMGMDGVLENVHRLGFFKECCEFYLIWADHWGAQGQRDKFNKIVEMCEENCHLSHFDSDELFKPLFVKYFDAEKSMDGQTLDLMKMLAPRKEDIRSDLTLFQHQHHTSNTQQGSTYKDGQQRGMGSGENGQLQQHKPTLQLQSTSVEAVVPMPTVVQPTVAPYHEEFSIFKDPTNIIHAPQKPHPLSNPNQPTNAAKVQQQDLLEFSVYKDQSNAIQPSSKKKPVTMTTPPHQELEEQEQKPPTQPAVEEKGDSDKKQSYYPDISDITLAGSHGKYASSVFTSTPRRSIMMTTFDPVLDAQKEQEQQFFDDLLDESQRAAGGPPGLFGTGTSSSKEMLAEGGGGSKLQKRLSLLTGEQPQQTRRESIGASGVATNSNAVTEAFERAKKAAKNTSYNLLKTLPKLKIGTSTPIMEVSEDKENTGNATANSAARTQSAATPFASPFRKKTRMDEQPKVSLKEEEQQKEAQSFIENKKVVDHEMADASPIPKLEFHVQPAVKYSSNIQPNHVTPSREQKSATQANGNNNQGRRQSYYPDMNDDVTMAGFHGKFSSTVFMSTPRRSIMPSAFDPVLDDVKEQEQQFFDDPIEESQRTAGGPPGPGLFGTAGTSSSQEEQANKATTTKNTSNANDMKAQAVQPNLKVYSTIQEVSEEKSGILNSWDDIDSLPY